MDGDAGCVAGGQGSKVLKVYELTVYDDDLGACLSWYGSLSALNRALPSVLAEHGKTGQEEAWSFYVYLIPRTKAGLLMWLNAHVTRDNG